MIFGIVLSDTWCDLFSCPVQNQDLDSKTLEGAFQLRIIYDSENSMAVPVPAFGSKATEMV